MRRAVISVATGLALLGSGGAEASIARPPGDGDSLVLAEGCAVRLPLASGTDPLAACGEHPRVAGLEPALCARVPLVDDRCEDWLARYDSPGSGTDGAGAGLSSANVVASSPDGQTVYTLAVTDRVPGSGYDYDLVVLASEAARGTTRWTASYPGAPSLPQAIPISIGVTQDRVYAAVEVATEDFFSGTCGWSTVALDATTGQRLWTAEEDGPPGLCSAPQRLSVDPGGRRVYVTGRTYLDDGRRAGLTVAYDAADGAREWSQRYEGAGEDESVTSAMDVAADGDTVYVAGTSKKDPVRSYAAGDYTLMAYAAATGAIRWQGTAPVAGNPPAGVAADPLGRAVYVAGGGLPTPLTPLFDIVTVAFDADGGALKWTANYEGPRAQIKSSFDSVWYYDPIAVAPDGARVYVADYSTGLSGVNLNFDMITLGYDGATGAQVWGTRYLSESESNWLPSVAVKPDGTRVYTTGESRYAANHTTARLTSLAYDAPTGSQAWVGRHTDGYTFYAGAAIGADGRRLYVAGTTADLTVGTRNYDALLAAYAA